MTQYSSIWEGLEQEQSPIYPGPELEDGRGRASG
jgi:hypothetical protein